ncbi:MAG: phage tail length tape measure family protein, partial [Roseovarius sp.]|nr:phage tail length tape measure family protein [Roseovarius sp.]
MMLVSARLTADEQEMVAALRRAREEMGRLQGTVSNSTEATRRASTGNEALSRSTRQVVEAQRQGQSVTEREAQTRTRAAQAGDRLAGSSESVRRTTRALTPDVQRAEQATRQFQGAMSNAAASAALVNGPLGGVASRFSTLAALSGRMNLAAVGVTVGLSAMVLGAGRAVRAFTDLERQQLTVQGTLQATGFAAGRTAGQLEDMARRIAADTLASAREVRAAQTVLLTFRSVAGETFDRAIELSQDLAAAGFGTLEGNAVQLGKALEDPVAGLTALTRVGVSFSPTARKMIRDFVEMGQTAEAQRLILEGVASQVGDLGRAAGAGASGGFDLVGENTLRFFELLGTSLNGQGRIGQLMTAIAGGIEEINRALEGPTESDRSREIVAENNRLVGLLEERQALLDEIATARGQGQDFFATSLENQLGLVTARIAETEARIDSLIGTAREGADEAAEAARRSAEAQRQIAEERFGKGRGAAAERDAFVFVEAERRRLLAAGIEGARLEAELLKIQKEANELFSSAPDAFFGRGGASGRVKKEVDTLSKVFEEFGQRFGGTLEFQERQIEAWRIKTLAELRAAGFGHAEYAGMVDQIARDRLKEAYEEDLRNRDDWAAGVERGLNDLFGAQRTMADIAEDTVKTAFKSMEDAFVSLART